MKRIGITQRVVYLEDIDERRDMLDQRWYDFAEEIGVRLIPIPNNLENVVSYIDELKLDGFIFSGGNNVGIFGDSLIEGKTIEDDDVAYERDKTEKTIIEWSVKKAKPIIGVCRGLQFINAYFSGVQDSVNPDIHVAKDHEILFRDEDWEKIYNQVSTVNSYHRYGINEDKLADELITTAIYNDRQIEAFKHYKFPLYGIMWHPERYDIFQKSDIEFFQQKLNLL